MNISPIVNALWNHKPDLYEPETDVLFHPLTAKQIREYLSKIHPLDKAGAYAIQDSGEFIIAEISGLFSNVVGLLIEQLRVELSAWADDAR